MMPFKMRNGRKLWIKKSKPLKRMILWELASLPDSQKPIRVKWFSKEKKNASSDS